MTGFPLALLHELAAEYTPPTPSETAAKRRPKGDDLARRIRAYLQTIPPSVQGQRGSDRTFYAAGRLVRGFDLSPEDAYPYLAEYSEKCQPPWSEKELWHKLRDAGRQPGPRGFLLEREAAPPGSQPGRNVFRNYFWDEIQDGDTVRKVKRGRRGPDLFDELAAYTGGWPRKVAGMLFVTGRDGKITWLRSSADLFAWIEWQYSIDSGGGVDWVSGGDCMPVQHFFSLCLQLAEDYDLVELYPHEPPISRCYYHHPDPAGGDGKALVGLLQHFAPASPTDEDLVLAFLLTLFWGGPPGQRPVIVFQASESAQQAGRGAGKSSIPNFAAFLVGGALSIGMDENEGEVQRRLLGPTGRVKRLAVIDNVKTLRFSSCSVEAMLTSREISGRQMFVGEGVRPNYLTWCMTFNEPSMGKDMATRSIVVEVDTPAYTPEWVRETERYMDEHRWAIIGDCLEALRKAAKLPDSFRYTRWAAWEAEVLACVPDPITAQQAIVARRDRIDDDEDIYVDAQELIRAVIREQFGTYADPDEMCVLIPSKVVAEKVVSHLHPRYGVDSRQAIKWLLTIKVPCVSKHDARRPYRGIIWRGSKCHGVLKFGEWDDMKLWGGNDLSDI